MKYDASGSGATNLGPTSADLIKAVNERTASDLVAEMRFASASGLDPHISLEAARAQVRRVALNRKLALTQTKELESLVDTALEPRQFGFLGEPRVNVLSLNLMVDDRFGK